MAKKYKKIWNSKEERDAWEAHVDQTIRRMRELFGPEWDRIWAEREAQRRASTQTPATEP